MRGVVRVFVALFVSVTFVISRLQRNREQEDVYNQCVNIKEPICQGLQYTKTKMPNLAGIANQEDSAKRLKDYFPLINADCSQYFRFFLCTVYFPMCSDAFGPPRILFPCKSICLYMQSRCEPYLRAFQLPWPTELNCERFPLNSSICIQPKSFVLDQNKRRLSPVDIDHFKKLYPKWNSMIHTSPDDPKPRLDVAEGVGTNSVPKSCSPPFVSSPVALPVQNLSGQLSCLLRCDANLLYNASDKYLAKVWLLVWAILGSISSFVAIAAFLLERKSRFKYPERPIVFIVICYGCVCVFHLVQLFLGKNRLVCQASQTNVLEQVVIREGSESPLCTLMFLGTFYFETVAAVWWLMLGVSCFLASARKWSAEALEGVSNVMHMVCWMVPALKVTVILIVHNIDSDELLGMCFVGRHRSSSNLIFVLLPRVAYFSIGVLLLLWSFRSLMLLRKNLTQPELKLFLDGFQNQQSLDKFIVKTGIFCGVYGFPMLCYIGCQFYMYFNIDKWNQIGGPSSTMDSRCLIQSGLRWTDNSCTNNLSLPLIEVRLLETFSFLVIGITSAMWMWCNKKTFLSFSEGFAKKSLCHRLSKPSINNELAMSDRNQFCFKNVNTAFPLECNTYQFQDFNRTQTRLPTSINQDTMCYNSNMII